MRRSRRQQRLKALGIAGLLILAIISCHGCAAKHSGMNHCPQAVIEVRPA